MMIVHAYNSFRNVNVFLDGSDKKLVEELGSLTGSIVVIDEEATFYSRIIKSHESVPNLKVDLDRIYEFSIPDRIFKEDEFESRGFYSLEYNDDESFESKRFCLIDVKRLKERRDDKSHYLELYELLIIYK